VADDTFAKAYRLNPATTSKTPRLAAEAF